MIKTSNKNSSEYTTRRINFKGSHLFADVNNNGWYVVYSYGYHFPIYAYINGAWIKNSDKYSVSTSRHQSQAEPDISWVGQKEMFLMNTQELKSALQKS